MGWQAHHAHTNSRGQSLLMFSPDQFQGRRDPGGRGRVHSPCRHKKEVTRTASYFFWSGKGGQSAVIRARCPSERRTKCPEINHEFLCMIDASGDPLTRVHLDPGKRRSPLCLVHAGLILHMASLLINKRLLRIVPRRDLEIYKSSRKQYLLGTRR